MEINFGSKIKSCLYKKFEEQSWSLIEFRGKRNVVASFESQLIGFLIEILLVGGLITCKTLSNILCWSQIKFIAVNKRKNFLQSASKLNTANLQINIPIRDFVCCAI